jgi:hypothetical protein
MNIRHPRQVKKLKSWGLFWIYHLNSTANLAHLPRNQAKWTELAVLFSLNIQNSKNDTSLFSH